MENPGAASISSVSRSILFTTLASGASPSTSLFDEYLGDLLNKRLRPRVDSEGVPTTSSTLGAVQVKKKYLSQEEKAFVACRKFLPWFETSNVSY